MNPTTLSEYYSSKGQSLPSVADRQGLAAQAGIQNYTGTAAQNNILLSSLNQGNLPSNLPTNSAPTIPLQVVTSPTQGMNLPARPQSMSPELGAMAGGYMAQPVVTNLNQLGGAAQVAGQNANQASSDYQSQVLNLINQTQNRPGELEAQYGIQGLSQDAMRAKANYDATELRYRREKEAMMVNGALSADQKQANINEIERKEASQKADIAIDYNLKQGLLSNAKELMNKQLELEIEPLKMKVDYFKELKNDYQATANRTEDRLYDKLSKDEQRVFDKAEKEADRAYQSARENAKAAQDLKMRALEAGLSWEQAKGIKSMEDLFNAMGETGGISNEIQDLLITASNIDKAVTDKTRGFRRGVGKRGLGRSAPETPRAGTKVADFRSDLDRLKGLLAKDNLKTLKGTISDKDIAFLERLGTNLSYTMTQTKFEESLKQLDDTFRRNYGVGFKIINSTANGQDPASLGVSLPQGDPLKLFP